MNRWSAAAFGALAGAMLVYPVQAAEAAWGALRLWGRSVAPVLGPFMVCMLMLTSRLGGGPWLRGLLSWLCGSPAGARLMQPLALTGRTALRFAALSGTMSPMFFLGTVSSWLHSPAAGRLILLCHWLGALILSLCIPARAAASAPASPPLALSAALRDSALALLTVCMCMMLGTVAARMAACALPSLPPWAAIGLQCVLEVASGIQALAAASPPLLIPFACAAASLGGLSLLLQNAAFWQESGVSLPSLAALRLCHGLISFLLCALLGRGLTGVLY